MRHWIFKCVEGLKNEESRLERNYTQMSASHETLFQILVTARQTNHGKAIGGTDVHLDKVVHLDLRVCSKCFRDREFSTNLYCYPNFLGESNTIWGIL